MRYIKKQELTVCGDTSGHKLPNGSVVTVMEVNKYDYLCIDRSNTQFYINEQDIKTI